MILVLAGTNPYPFTRLLQAVDHWALDTGTHVVAQSGHTPTTGLSMECHAFVPHAQILEWIKQAETVICQGGLGSLRDCLRAGKPVVAVPRRPELGESQDVQEELVAALAAEGRVVQLDDMSRLGDAINEARKLPPGTPMQSDIPELVAARVRAVMGQI